MVAMFVSGANTEDVHSNIQLTFKTSPENINLLSANPTKLSKTLN